MKTAVIGDRETVAGFALGGVSMRFIVEDGTVKDAFQKVVQSGDVAVLFITPPFAGMLEEEIAALKEKHSVYPIVVVLPGEDGDDSDRIDTLIRRAVGIGIERDGSPVDKEGGDDDGRG